MSYSVELETLPIDPAMGRQMTRGLSVDTFANGEAGPCVQITPHGDGFVQLDAVQLEHLRAVLDHAQGESLASWPEGSYSRQSALNAEVSQLRAELRNFATLVDRGMRGIGRDTDDSTIQDFIDRYSAGETPVRCPECDVMPPGATADCRECARILAEDAQ